MLLLAIETSTARSSVALVDRDRVLATATLGLGRRHGEFVAPAITFCLAQAGRRVEDVTGVAVGLGPGLYTGLRVGVVTASVFAAARDLPCVGLTCTDVLAFRARHTRRLVCVAIDARRGEVYSALYRATPGGSQCVRALEVGAPERLAEELRATGEDALVVGDATERHGDVLAPAAALAGPELGRLVASDLGTLARDRFLREATVRASELEPVYLREADAQIGWQQLRREGAA